MRKLTTFDTQPEARFIRDALVGGGVAASVKRVTDTEGDSPQAYAVWVHDDTDLDPAHELLLAYEADPEDPRIASLAKRGPTVRRQEAKAEQEYKKKVERAHRDLERKRIGEPQGAFATIGFILLCIGVAFFTELGNVGLSPLAFHLPSIARGEVWRLVTPAVVHLGLMHIAFNLMWVYSLGRRIESARSSRYLVAQLLVFGVSGVVLDGLLSPAMGFGASGIVYGLAGFLFVHGRIAPGSAMRMEPEFFALLMVFWAVGYASPALHIANWAHTGGLVAGLLWGVVSGMRERAR